MTHIPKLRLPVLPPFATIDLPAALLLPAPAPAPVRLSQVHTAPAALPLPFGTTAAAAAWRAGPDLMLAFDQPHAIDAASLAPLAPGIRVTVLPHATIVRLPWPPGGLSLQHDPNGWSLAPGPATAPDAPVQQQAGTVTFALPGYGHVVAVPDPLTGANLLVGTTTGTAAPAAGSRHPQFAVRPSLLGLVVDPLSDQVALRPVDGGYRVESARPDLPLSLAALAPLPAADVAPPAASLTRQASFPALPPPALMQRLKGQFQDAAMAPVSGRLPYRLAAAQTLLALGMGAEASGLLSLAASDDPRALQDPFAQSLAALAALLAGRPPLTGQQGATLQPSPDETDEHRLWRALQDPATPPVPPAVQAIARGLNLLLAYPAGLQARLLPLAAAALVRGGDTIRAAALFAARPQDHTLDLSRAEAAERAGQHPAALALYDALAAGKDVSTAAAALVDALRLRHADHQLTDAEAAQAGDRRLYAWRGDARERDFRFLVAGWYGAAGDYRRQLALLRETRTLFPGASDGASARLAAAFATLLHDPDALAARLTAFDQVALLQENADLLPDGSTGEALASLLADRLVALDLPDQAETVLEHLRTIAAPAPAAAFAARLAALQLAEGNARPALDVLTATETPGLSAPLAERRAVLQARAHAALGDRPAALATLSPLGADPPALLERASMQEDAHDWPAAEGALGAYADSVLPATGTLNTAQSGIVLRLASAAAQASDEAGLARLTTRFAARLDTREDQALLAVLTEKPVRATSDLPRAGRETVSARAVVDGLRTN